MLLARTPRLAAPVFVLVALLVLAVTPTPAPYAWAQGPGFATELEKRFPLPPPKPPWPPRHGGVLVYGRSPVPNLDPFVGRAYWMHLQVWNPLVEQEINWHYPEIQFQPRLRPVLAERWEVAPDGMSATFYLRKGVRYANVPPVRGRELVAEDVKFSFERHMEKGTYQHKVTDIASVEVLDRYTVKFNLKRPLPTFPALLADGLPVPVFPPEAYKADGGLHANFVGTGPFVLKYNRPGESYLFERNPNYWEKDKDGRQLPYVDAIKGFILPDYATEVAAFRTKQVDFLPADRLDQVREILKTTPDVYVYRTPSFGWGNISMHLNLEKAPFNDVRVRRAMSMAIDRAHIVESLYGGDGDWWPPIPWSYLGKMSWPRNYSMLGPWYQHNPKRARELLKEAGYPQGFKTTLTYNRGERRYPYEEGALMFATFLKDIGISVDVRGLEAGAFLEQRMGGKWDGILLFTTPSGPPNWDVWVYHAHHSKSPVALNPDPVRDPNLDALLDGARNAKSQEEFERANAKVVARLLDQVYRVTGVVQMHYMLHHPYVKNLSCAPYSWIMGYGEYNLKNAWLSADAPRATDRPR